MQIRGLLFSSFPREYGKEEEDQMFGKAKGSSHQKDEPLPPAPQLHDPCEFGRVRFDGYLLHRSRHDSCR